MSLGFITVTYWHYYFVISHALQVLIYFVSTPHILIVCKHDNYLLDSSLPFNYINLAINAIVIFRIKSLRAKTGLLSFIEWRTPITCSKRILN